MDVGSKVEHILTRDWFLVLEVKDLKMLCRTKDYSEIWFYRFELRPL